MKRILIVDDDTDIQAFCRAKLSAFGHEVATAGGVDEAIALIGKSAFDLLIIDINMPGKNGFELLRALRQTPGRGFKILMLTGRRTSEDVLMAFSLGAIEYVCKPIQNHVFFPKVQALLGVAAAVSHEPYLIQAAAEAEAWIASRSAMFSLSDSGAVVDVELFVDAGAVLKLDSPIFAEIGIAAPTFRVSECELGDEKAKLKFRITGQFVGLDETASAKIRNWISQRPRGARKAA